MITISIVITIDICRSKKFNKYHYTVGNGMASSTAQYLFIDFKVSCNKKNNPVITAIHVFDGFENVQLCTCYEYMTKTARYSVIYKLCWHIKKWHTDNYVKNI